VRASGTSPATPLTDITILFFFSPAWLRRIPHRPTERETRKKNPTQPASSLPSAPFPPSLFLRNHYVGEVIVLPATKKGPQRRNPPPVRESRIPSSVFLPSPLSSPRIVRFYSYYKVPSLIAVSLSPFFPPLPPFGGFNMSSFSSGSDPFFPSSFRRKFVSDSTRARLQNRCM